MLFRSIGIKQSHINHFRLKNGGLDGMELLDIINILHYKVSAVKPEIIYTHYYDDLNIDHQIVSRAVITHFRALPRSSVKEILFFETLSSTEQARSMYKSFCANFFVDITKQLEIKLNAMSCYKSELRDFPHPRNLDCIKYNAILQGTKIGVDAAEAFMVSRIIR